MNRGNAIFNLLIYTIFLYYILQLEKNKCYCSTSWEKDYIKYFSIIMIFLSLLKLLYPENGLLINISTIIFFMGGIILIIAVFRYIKYLNRINCKCSKNWKRNILNIYSWIILIIFSLLIIVSIILSIIVAMNYTKLKK